MRSSAVCGPESGAPLTVWFETWTVPLAATNPEAIWTPSVAWMSSEVVCVAVSGTAKLRPRTLKSSEATLVEVDCTKVRSRDEEVDARDPDQRARKRRRARGR